MEKETLAVLWAVTESDYNVRFAKKFDIFMDNKNVGDIWKLQLHDIKNKSVFKLRGKLLAYNINIVHVKGNTNAMADRLSCYPHQKLNRPDLDDRVIPQVASKSLRLKSSENKVDDPQVAMIGKNASDYKYVRFFLRDTLSINTVDKDSDFKNIDGDYNTLSLFDTKDREVIL